MRGHPGREVSFRLELLEQGGEEECGEEEDDGPEEHIGDEGPMFSTSRTYKLTV